MSLSWVFYVNHSHMSWDVLCVKVIPKYRQDRVGSAAKSFVVTAMKNVTIMNATHMGVCSMCFRVQNVEI